MNPNWKKLLISKPFFKQFRYPAFILGVILLALPALACTWSLITPPDLPTQIAPTATLPLPPTPTAEPQVQVTFEVTVPEETPSSSQVSLDILDEVTGLMLNFTRYPMEAISNQHYTLALSFPVGSIIKYRFSRQGLIAADETNAMGETVRYRMAWIQGATQFSDVIAGWTDLPYNGPTGQIEGQAIDATNGKPLPNVMILAAGQRTFTRADGSFALRNVLPGSQKIAAMDINGDYQFFQQGAVVAANEITPAPISLQPAQKVRVVFTVRAPNNTINGAPVRFVGNLYPLGNTFADLNIGESTLATRMPVLSQLPDGRYTITLELPVGFDLRYKYSLGDGLWNSEHAADGAFRVRQFIIPPQSTGREDVITSWQSGNSAPIYFDLTTPPETPEGDSVSIQFKTGIWTEPLPMWFVGENHWIYALFSPLDMMGTFSYRYCRNEQCNAADAQSTVGESSVGHPISTSLLQQTVLDKVKSWQWLLPDYPTPTIQAGDISPRKASFMAGVAFMPNYHPSWQNRMQITMNTLHNQGANWVVLSPTWTFRKSSPLIFQPQPGSDPLEPDILDSIQRAQATGLQVALFPQPHFSDSPSADFWWQSAPRDSAWWDDWFTQYRTFLLHFATLAEQSGVQKLVIGGPWLSPALTSGAQLADGSPSGAPLDANLRWRNLIAEIKTRFSGTLLWAMDAPPNIDAPILPYLENIDQFYLLWSVPLANSTYASLADMEAEAKRVLEGQILPFQVHVNRPIILAVAYPSADGGVTGCLNSMQGGCLSWDALAPPNADISNIRLDLQEQADAYNAMLLAVNQQNWVSGFVSQGYYPPAILQDKSTSIHGKPAGDVLRYWFQKMLATP